MSFEDHPRRFVPSFRLQDPEANANLNMIDLLAHRSGLDRSDLTWLLAPFTQDELFELAFRSTPAAKLRERFMYNNAMYALAGAAVAGAAQTSYQHFMTERLFKPLGMSSTTVTFAGLTKSPNRAVGLWLQSQSRSQAPKAGQSGIHRGRRRHQQHGARHGAVAEVPAFRRPHRRNEPDRAESVRTCLRKSCASQRRHVLRARVLPA